ncbi:hypothetical protein [Plantactinospora sonchi]|uniref:Uncharacterized protein n=1 Tax=Plantactinospora sonchi TaxID=1544735 RepID=A0ABU7RL69_9ACTN
MALIVVLPFIWYATIASIGDDDLPLLALGALVVTASAVLLVTALIAGRVAVHGDAVTVSAARTSARLGKVGGLTGWIGAGAVLVLAVVLALRDVDLALVKGVPLVAASLIPAVFNDRARQIADTAAGRLVRRRPSGRAHTSEG